MTIYIWLAVLFALVSLVAYSLCNISAHEDRLEEERERRKVGP